VGHQHGPVRPRRIFHVQNNKDVEHQITRMGRVYLLSSQGGPEFTRTTIYLNPRLAGDQGFAGRQPPAAYPLVGVGNGVSSCARSNFSSRHSASDSFLGALPRTFRYAIEVRNREYLQPRYFDCLGQHRAAHVLNAWTKMPVLSEQIAMPDAFPTDFTVARALLRQGRAYEDAVQQFAPYDRVRDENPEARESLANEAPRR
jgi:hypothetical protein